MLNKLSRKDIELLNILAQTPEGKSALNEYIEQHEKAVKAYKVYRESVVAEVEVEKVVKPVESKRKFKVGDKVRVLRTGSLSAATLLREGDIAVVTGYKEHDNFMLAAMGGEPLRPVIVRSMEGGGLLSTYPTGFFEESALELVEEKSPNELRAEIIQRAKDFVEKHRNITMVKLKGKNRMVDINYIVNAEKRTVIVLLKCALDNKVEVKGIAKCSPDDVFNEHIGKAIALGRAIGKDVSEFENAPQPTKVVVGQEVKTFDEQGEMHTSGKVEIVTWDKERIPYHEKDRREAFGIAYPWTSTKYGFDITGDTDAIYEEGTK